MASLSERLCARCHSFKASGRGDPYIIICGAWVIPKDSSWLSASVYCVGPF